MTLKFNLAYDPWIKVLDMGNAVMEVSLSDLFRNATSYRRFAGERTAGHSRYEGVPGRDARGTGSGR